MGRRLVSVRVCSCPKRDKEKEEKDLEKNDTGPSKKKRKTERVVPEGQSFCDDQMFTLNVSIVRAKKKFGGMQSVSVYTQLNCIFFFARLVLILF